MTESKAHVPAQGTGDVTDLHEQFQAVKTWIRGLEALGQHVPDSLTARGLQLATQISEQRRAAA